MSLIGRVFVTFGHMNKLMAITLIGFILLSCGSSQKLAKRYLLEDAPSVHQVTINFKYVPAYCGGAAPTPEMEAARRKGSFWRNQIIYMNKDQANNFESFLTDQYGRLNLSLFKGNYCLKMPYKIEPKRIEQHRANDWEFNEDCLQSMISKCDFNFEVTGDTILNFSVYGRCQYEGPIPCVSNPGMPPP